MVASAASVAADPSRRHAVAMKRECSCTVSSRAKLAAEDAKNGRLARTIPPLHSQGFTAIHGEGHRGQEQF